eukprot:95931-Pelagomonas_calceolata.AAC.1
MAKTSKHTTGSFMASADQIRQFVPQCASMHLGTDRIYRSGWEKHGRRGICKSTASAPHEFPKGRLGVKRVTTNWVVLRECGHLPFQFYWLKSTAKMNNGLLNSISEALRKVFNADLHSRAPLCSTAQNLDGFQGLWRCESFITAMKQGTPISMEDFTDD